ncbi:MAG: hypothetical protein OXE96_06880 [Gemmatimonadetes bacterium]|nr:hypothetical protein [Gemmatimonadota bacterium]
MLEAMNEFGVDTLKAARTLEAAGFESGKAEALVTVFGGPAAGSVATRVQVQDLTNEMKQREQEAEKRARSFRAEIQGVRTELEARIQGVRTELKAEIQGVRTELKAEIAEVRLSVESLKAHMYKLFLAQTVLIVSLIVALDRLL